MDEYREVTLEERQAMRDNGIFDINGNIPAHPGYTGIHKHSDGTFWLKGHQITDVAVLDAIEHRNDIGTEAVAKKRATHWFRRIWIGKGS